MGSKSCSREHFAISRGGVFVLLFFIDDPVLSSVARAFQRGVSRKERITILLLTSRAVVRT